MEDDESKRFKRLRAGFGPCSKSRSAWFAPFSFQDGVETYLIERKMDNCKPCGGAIPLCMIDEFDLPKDIVDRQATMMMCGCHGDGCFLGWFASPMAWDEWWQSVTSFGYLSKTCYPHRSHCQASCSLMANLNFGLPGLGAQDDYDFTNQQGSSDWSNLEGWWVHWHGPLLGVNPWTNLDRSSKGYPVAFRLGRNMMRKGASYFCTKCSM